MEKEEQRKEVAPLAMPNLSLSVPYQDALHYVQGRLKMLGTGMIKSFCDKQQLPYTQVVGLKNNTIIREEARFVRRILVCLDVQTELVQYPPASNKHRFVFSSAEALATFQQQLTYLTSHE